MNNRTSLPLPPALEAKLADFRRRVWIIKLLEGVLAAIFGLALSYVLVFALDRFFETPGWVRGLLLLAGAAVLGLGLPLKWHRWVWRQRRLEDAAKLLRQKMPRLGDQLLGIVELARMDSESTGRSERLVQAAMAQAAEAVKDVPFEEAVPEDKHRPWGFAAAAGLVVALLAFFVVPAAAWNALARWITPWRQVDRYTFAKVEALPKRLVVPYAEPVKLKAVLAKDTEWSPKSGAVQIEDQPKVKASLAANSYDFALPPQKKNAPLDLKVGDVRKTVELAPTQRPELKTLQARLELPAYLQYTTQPVIEARSGSLSLLKGAKASFELTASRDLAAATMDGATQPLSKGHVVTPLAPVKETTQHVFTWTDADGLAARDPLTLKVQAVEDDAPRVLARRDSQEQVILESEVVNFDLEVSDDFGIKRTGLEWRGLDTVEGAPPSKGDAVSGSGAPEKKELAVRATFCAQRDGVPPQSLEVKAWAEDYLPGRARSYSPGFVIHVLNKDDHAVWLTEQFGKWLQASRETYEHEQRLHETNQELRNMSPEELDRPENRRKVAQQALAESSNGDRLGRLNDSGRRLIEQAARNDAFNAQRLETWAQMLKALKDIADKRMPSVADLLKQSANAKAGEPGEPSQGMPSGKNNPAPQNQAQAQPGKPTDPKSGGSTNPDSNAKPPAPGTQSEAPPEKSAPKIAQGEQSQGNGPPKKMDPNAPSPPKAPSIADNEKSNFKPGEPKPQDPNAQASKPSSGKLSLPTTTLGSPAKDAKPQPTGQPGSAAQKKMDVALDEQKQLLEAFAKVTDELRNLLASLEGSTFVKRLKMASRKQMGIANDLNAGTLAAFGMEKRQVAEKVTAKAKDIAARAVEQSSVVRVIQSDLEAYYQRKQDTRFKKLIDQMNKVEIVTALAHVGDEVNSNLSGRGINASEFWADTLDRWAEELVAAAEAGGKCEGGSQDSLPPEIVLKVMKVLHDEMALRDETREAENGKAAMEKKAYFKRSTDLAIKQDDIGRRTYEAAYDISKLPKAQSFGKEMKLLSQVTEVMKDAYKYLDQQNTGGPAVAAETEAIELLLATRRQPPGGGGGGGNNPGGGGGGAATMAALSEIGPGVDPTAHVKERETGQSTGKAGREFPDEFKAGLDAYFNALEKGGAK